MTNYEIWCCTEHVATFTLDDRRGRWSIESPEGEESLNSGYVLDFVDLAPDDVHGLIHAEATGRHVTELTWGGLAHQRLSWVIRCLTCVEQFEIAESQLPWLAHIAQSGDWSVTNGVIPLQVLNRARPA